MPWKWSACAEPQSVCFRRCLSSQKRRVQPEECHVCYSVVTKLLSCRSSEAHAILFLFLVFDLCLSSARRVFTLLILAGLCSFVLVVAVGSEGSLSLSKVSWSPRVHTLPFGPAARMQSELLLSG